MKDYSSEVRNFKKVFMEIPKPGDSEKKIDPLERQVPTLKKIRALRVKQPVRESEFMKK